MTIAERHNPLSAQLDSINGELAALESEIMIVRNAADGIISIVFGDKSKRIADLNARKESLFSRKRQLIAKARQG